MTDEGSSPGERALRLLADALTRRAREAGLDAADAPELVAAGFDGGGGDPATTLDEGDLPLVRLGLSIGRYRLVLGLLPETADEALLAQTMRQHRNQCVVARSTLASAAALDLQLVMVGPRGSEEKDAWRAVALGIERDDRVARKLVWLRPSRSEDDPESFDAFVKRTFLARPWLARGRFAAAELDSIAAIVDAGETTRDTAGRWTRLAVERGGEPDSLVDGLVQVWSERSAI